MAREIRFQFEQFTSSIFPIIYRPVIRVHLKSKKGIWIPARGIVDTGADYTLLPKWYAQKLGIDLKKDCVVQKSMGIGGEEKSYVYLNAKVKVGNFTRIIPVGFLDREDIPPLFGRQGLLETFELIFKNHETIFKE